jgi:hypothetical protein
MRRHFLASSAIADAGYNPRRRILEVRFVGGSVYQYLGVPQEVYRRFLRAASKGSFLNARIKGRYGYVAVR